MKELSTNSLKGVSNKEKK